MIFLGLLDTEEEQDKFEALFHRYRGMMFYAIKDIIDDEFLSEDILQEALIKIANNIGKVDDDISSNLAKSFILTITKHTALDYYRKNAKRREVECSMDEYQESVFCIFDEDYASKLDNESKVMFVIKNMNDTYRDIFIMKYVHGFENSEIAKLFGITEETVRKRISRGKKMLEEKLEGMGK